MNDESREQILADFQNCTGVENFDECLLVLEQYHWNLQNAVHAVLEGFGMNHDPELVVPAAAGATNPSSVEPKPMKSSQEPDDSAMDDVQIINTVPAHPPKDSSTTPKPKARDLDFTIEYLDNTVRLTLSDQNTVQQLRKKIAERLKVPEDEQNFLNWMQKTYDDRTPLKNLNLPKENTIRLSLTSNGTTNRTTTSAFREFNMQTGGDFPLTIHFEDKNGKSVPISPALKPNTTIREMKQKVEQCTHIPVDRQQWTNLYGAQDGEQLGQTKIPFRSNLLVREQRSAPATRDTSRTILRSNTDDEPMQVDHEILIDDEDESVSLGQTSVPTGVKITDRDALIPEACADDTVALEHFSRVFHRRYGSTGPFLYIGSLDEAIQEALYASIDNRRPLAIYLHNDQSVCANVFCSQVLSADTIIEYLANNYVVWAWDMTMDSNRQRLMETLRRCVGAQGAQRIDEMEGDHFPVLLILTRTRGTLELMDMIEGKSSVDEALTSLIQSHESFDQQRRRDADEELVREQREQLKRQQEDEYQRSLVADLEKERQRQDDERKQKEEQDEQERQQQLRLKKQQECQARLPAEPNETEKNITRFKIRLPDDEGIIMRRFRISETLQTLFDYLTSQGRMFGEYKLLTTYPKRDLIGLNPSDTFEQLKLFPQEQLILESL